jgi:nitrogen-specific signal transduction histidine kinase
LPPEILPRIFEPFVSTKANGMGLGLAICRRLIEMIVNALNANDQNRTRATEILGISRRTLQNKIKEYDL